MFWNYQICGRTISKYLSGWLAPIFFISVRTNSGYCVVTEFIVQSESATYWGSTSNFNLLEPELETKVLHDGLLRGWNSNSRNMLSRCHCTCVISIESRPGSNGPEQGRSQDFLRGFPKSCAQSAYEKSSRPRPLFGHALQLTIAISARVCSLLKILAEKSTKREDLG